MVIEKLNNQLSIHLESLSYWQSRPVNSRFALENHNCISFQSIVMFFDNETLISFELVADYHYTPAPSWWGVKQSSRYDLTLFFIVFN